ncbi:glycosyltransferase [uncultured Lentibacter sp.]|uniref:glycosyltransferase n=1 Tax=uncultured Lentibacter sp. TaxID=1659309 RepID=UPI0026325071|nr:glycosyltransferase [uncultured Lentibacter sp.]MCW1955957.1 glycosyltransferase [Roseobacter sp.]
MSAAQTLRARIGAVVIGRNEGQRLVNCLRSLQGEVDLLVYVDSGSTDGSLATAQAFGAQTVPLSRDLPFTAARARNAGFEKIMARPDAPEFVQFVDGDCTLEPGYLGRAAAALAADPELGLVTGWRAEIHPEASIYNEMCEFEWHRPAGDICACGGDMMVRARAFEAVGGFNPAVIAAEDDEFCTRLRKAGHRLRRLAIPMTHHDANMSRFSEWWSRAVRTGHGFEQVNDLHPEYFIRERRRMWLFGGLLPLLALSGAVVFWPLFACVGGLYAVSYLRTVRGLVAAGLRRNRAPWHAAYLFLSKFPNIIGAARYRKRKRLGSAMEIIEYK